MRLGLVVLCAAGCGRLQFDAVDTISDATPDASVCVSPIGHDEDGDSIDDACDVCPSIADDGQDTDGDKVGDVCDPLPTDPSQRISMFDPFTQTSSLWRYGSIATITGDALTINALTTGTSPELVVPPGVERLIAVGSIGAVATTSHQFTIQIMSSTTASYYCELYEDADTFFLSTTTYDGTTYTSLAKRVIASPFANGAFMLTLDHFPPFIGCSAVWQGQTYTLATAPIPSGISADIAQLGINRANVLVTSFTRISSTL